MVFLEIPNVPLGTVFAETVTYYVTMDSATSFIIGLHTAQDATIRLTATLNE